MKSSFLFAAKARLWRPAALASLASLSSAGLVLLFSGCADKESPRDETALLPADERVSSVPWNKPQGWENQGALGSLANDPRIGGQVQP